MWVKLGYSNLTVTDADGSAIDCVATDLIEKWHKIISVRRTQFNLEDKDLQLKKADYNKNLPKVTLPLLENRGSYLQFAFALVEQTRDFTNPSTKEYEGDKPKLLQIIKNAMVFLRTKRLLEPCLTSGRPLIISMKSTIVTGTCQIVVSCT